MKILLSLNRESFKDFFSKKQEEREKKWIKEREQSKLNSLFIGRSLLDKRWKKEN